ncbi:DUF2927 domain-containing protein [Paracoccus tibetensis]|uniref:DUF2927 domain-containing protein n=1 Tax=Paracoccus tibetensis TaxID=336292 RepID=A0A1G5C0L2_9RHOB|nr:DUF2927 domain-containing protein [Paracoccus tibetensis]SCX95911.1 Protein of unknown function [Paracoccus tibetensis]
MIRRRDGRTAGRPMAALALAGLLLAACEAGPTAPTSEAPRPQPRPEAAIGESAEQARIRAERAERNRAANAAAVQASAAASPASRTQRDYYARMEARLLAQGRLRTDRVPLDAPIDPETLAQNFVQIALRDEYRRDNGALVADAQPAPLRRWDRPVRMQLEFGASADVAAQRAVRAEVADFAGRLASASGHPVTLTGDGGNFVIMVVTEDERRAMAPRLAQLVPGIPASDLAVLTDLPPAIACTVFAYSEGANPVYARAVAVIRAELPRLLRNSCIHEELAQGMGLANDSPAARPSIFNDDEEFALLTRHDELLLRILYDRRLRPGMSEAEALPIVRRIAAELLAAPA